MKEVNKYKYVEINVFESWENKEQDKAHQLAVERQQLNINNN